MAPQHRRGSGDANVGASAPFRRIGGDTTDATDGADAIGPSPTLESAEVWRSEVGLERRTSHRFRPQPSTRNFFASRALRRPLQRNFRAKFAASRELASERTRSDGSL